MATISWVVFKHHKKADGTYNPKIRVYHNGRSVYLATPIFTPFVRFKKGEATGRITDGDLLDVLNTRVKNIRQLLNQYDHVVDCCETAKDVADFIVRKQNQGKELDFVKFLQEQIEGAEQNGGVCVKVSLLSNLKGFIGEESLPVTRVTSSFLKRFETWLRSERILSRRGVEQLVKPVGNSTLRVYMQAFQTVFNRMRNQYNDYEIGDIVIPGDPFKAYSPAWGGTFQKRAVPTDTVRLIAGYKPTGKKMAYKILARDMFVLSFCLAGMNLIDMYNCEKYEDGRIVYCRTKTTKRKKDRAYISVPIFPEAAGLFETYRGNSRVFNLSDRFRHIQNFRVVVARGMKEMCAELGIEPVTFYTARHSFATIARNDCDVSMDDIALCLTHSSGFAMTDTYVKPDFGRVDRVIRKVLDVVFK